MVSDEEYDAALELELWCNDKIELGVESTDDLSLSDQAQYLYLLTKWERYSLQHVGFKDPSDSYEKHMAQRMSRIISLLSQNIILKYCK